MVPIQVKPKVFISSTVRDFLDLRSTMKYWLEELGFEVLLSEFNDIDKPIEPNAFDACFEAIRRSDYYLLLIGERRGALYTEQPPVSVTQQEYRVAYEQARQGRCKLVLLVRESVWQIYNYNQGLESRNGESSNDSHAQTSEIEDHAFVYSFIDEVTRRVEVERAVSSGGDYPISNWLHRFGSFRDITDVLRVALQAKVPLHRRALETNLENELIENIRILCGRVILEGKELPFPEEALSGRLGQDISLKEEFEKLDIAFPFPQYFWLSKTRKSIVLRGEELSGKVRVSRKALSELGNFCIAAVASMSGKLQHSALDVAVSSGAFLGYDHQLNRYVIGPEQRSLLKLQELLGGLNSRSRSLETPFPPENFPITNRLIMLAKDANTGKLPNGTEIPAGWLALVFGTYDIQVNVLAQTVNLLRWLKRQIPVPEDITFRPLSPVEGESEKIELGTLPASLVANPVYIDFLRAMVHSDLPSAPSL